jgi:hypothetical protein
MTVRGAWFESQQRHLASWECSWFSSVHIGTCWNITSFRLRLLSFQSYIINLSSVILPFDDIVTWRLRAGIVEAEETFITRQRLWKYVPAATNTQATIQGLLGKCVLCWVRPEPQTNWMDDWGIERELRVGSQEQGTLKGAGAVVELIVGSWRNWKSSARADMTRGPERGKLKNLHC